jgi:hypothetical protein
MSKPIWLRGTWRLGAREQRRLQVTLIGIICVLLAFVLYQPMMDFIQRRDFQICQSNARKIAVGMMTYSQDYDDTLPLAATWADAASSHMVATSGTGKDVRSYFRCPLDSDESACSYCYNAAMEAIPLTVRSEDPAMRARRARLGRIELAALVIEKHASAWNAFVTVFDWNGVRDTLGRPHKMPEGSTGTLVLGKLEPASRNGEQLNLLAGKRF